MQRRQFLTLPAQAALAAPGFATPSAANRRMNVLFVTADDLGPMLSCYGERRIATPNLDRLAASGVRFSTAYVAQASCSPSRSAMFTGLFPHSNGQYGLANTGYALHEHLHRATIPAVLKPAGYRTGIIGKLHVEPETTFPFDERPRGIDMRKVRDIARAAGSFLQKGGSQPFFLMVNYSDPHAFRDPKDSSKWFFPEQVDGLPEKPIPPTRETLFPFQQVDTPEQRLRTANYYNAVLRLDVGIGMLMDELKQSGHLEDTLVVFLGDHGPPFDRGKTTCYDAALKVPFLVRWPGVSRPVVSRALVSSVDIAPTIYDAAGVQGPVKMHGRSLRPVLTGSTAGWREYLPGEFHYHGANLFFPRRVVRDQRYHLIHNLLAGRAKPPLGIDGDSAHKAVLDQRYEGTAVRRAFDTYANPPEFEVYDLEKDPAEFNNLAGKPEARAVERRMKEGLLAWRKESEDPFLEPAYLEKVRQEGAPVTRNRKKK